MHRLFSIVCFVGGGGNGKQMNRMWKQARSSSKALRAGGLHPNVKRSAQYAVKAYWRQLGRNTAGEVTGTATQTVTSNFIGVVSQGSINALRRIW